MIDVVKEAKRRAYSPGETVLSAGETSNCFYIVCRGTVKCLVDGNEVRSFAAGSSFGDMAIYFLQLRALFQEHQDILGDAGTLDKMYVQIQKNKHKHINFKIVLNFVSLGPEEPLTLSAATLQ